MRYIRRSPDNAYWRLCRSHCTSGILRRCRCPRNRHTVGIHGSRRNHRLHSRRRIPRRLHCFLNGSAGRDRHSLRRTCRRSQSSGSKPGSQHLRYICGSPDNAYWRLCRNQRTFRIRHTNQRRNRCRSRYNADKGSRRQSRRRSWNSGVLHFGHIQCAYGSRRTNRRRGNHHRPGSGFHRNSRCGRCSHCSDCRRRRSSHQR